MVYEWKEGSRFPVNAQVAGEMCAELEKEGRLTAKNLLDANRPENAPLHDAFNWNDDEAAELYREEQARKIIRCIVVKRDNVKEPVRQFINVEISERKYYSVDVLLKTESTRNIMLRTALAELKAFQKKYRILKELTNVFTAIDQLKIDEIINEEETDGISCND